MQHLRIYLVLRRTSNHLHFRRNPDLYRPPEIWSHVAKANDAGKGRRAQFLGRVSMMP